MGISRRREISKSRWASFCDVHGDAISIAASNPSTEPSAVPGRGKPLRLAINAAQLDVHEADGPIAAGGLREPDEFPGHRFTHKHEAAPPLDLPTRADAAHLAGRVIPGILEARRIGAGRDLIGTGRRGLAERFMGPHGIEDVSEAIKPPLLLARGGRGGVVLSVCNVR